MRIEELCSPGANFEFMDFNRSMSIMALLDSWILRPYGDHCVHLKMNTTDFCMRPATADGAALTN